jgi:hypothetical protein
MSKKTSKLLIVLVLLSFILTGCYYFAAKKEIQNAEKSLSELKGEGGATLVPYEYTSAEKFLEISNLEFNENDFKKAKGFATRSKSAAETGLTEVKKKK